MQTVTARRDWSNKIITVYYIQDGQSADRGFTQSIQTIIPHNMIHPPPSIVFPTIRVHLTVHFDYIKSRQLREPITFKKERKKERKKKEERKKERKRKSRVFDFPRDSGFKTPFFWKFYGDIPQTLQTNPETSAEIKPRRHLRLSQFIIH